MQAVASWLIYLGLALTVIGLAVGFGAMFSDADATAVNALVLVPLGFALGLTGLTIGQLLAGSSHSPAPAPDPDD